MSETVQECLIRKALKLRAVYPLSQYNWLKAMWLEYEADRVGGEMCQRRPQCLENNRLECLV